MNEPGKASLILSCLATLAPIAGFSWTLVILIRDLRTLGTNNQLPAGSDLFAILGNALIPMGIGLAIALIALGAWHLLQFLKHR